MSINLIPIKGATNPPSPKIIRFRMSALLAETGLYRTPFKASGTRRMIIIALKITALRIALWGEPRFMTFNAERGPTPDFPE